MRGITRLSWRVLPSIVKHHQEVLWARGTLMLTEEGSVKDSRSLMLNLFNSVSSLWAPFAEGGTI
jgi:hypothetical protein